MSTSILILCCLLPLWHSCEAVAWIRHRWIDLTFKTNLKRALEHETNSSAADNFTPHVNHRGNNLCGAILNFTLYVLGEEDMDEVNRVLTDIKKFYSAVFLSPLFEPHTRMTQNTDEGPVTVMETTCIDTPNVSLRVLYLPFMPSLNYVYASVTASPENASSLPNPHFKLFALAEADGTLDWNFTIDLRNLEQMFLVNVHEASVLPHRTSNTGYDICDFNIDDHFRLCSSTWNTVLNHLSNRFDAKILIMPERYMYNVCSESRVKFRFQHLHYNTTDLRVRTVSCQLSDYEFYLMASVSERGAIFVLFEIPDEDSRPGSRSDGVHVAAYLRWVPVLNTYDS